MAHYNGNETGKLHLDCIESSPGRWRVMCTNTGVVLSDGAITPEYAWATACDRLAGVINRIHLTTDAIFSG